MRPTGRIFWILGLFLALALAGSEGHAAGKKKTHRKKSTAKKRPATAIRNLLENPDSPEFTRFLSLLRESRKNPGSNPGFMLLGDSHMQCEDFGLELVRYFRDSLRIPVAGRGYLFPYPLARTSHRSDMSFFPTQSWKGCRFTKLDNACSWGLSGWTAHCGEDSVVFYWKQNRDQFRAGDQLTVLSPLANSGDYKVVVSDSMGNGSPLRYMPSKSGYFGTLPVSGKTLKVTISRIRPGSEFVLQGLVLDPAVSGLRYGLSGTNGARLDHYLQNPDFQRHLRVLNPGLVMVSLGTNDVFSPAFQAENAHKTLKELLSRIKSALPDAAVILIGPPDHGLRKRKGNPRIAEINRVFSSTAEELDFVFWNQQAAMGGKGAIFSWRKRGLATRDMVHFTPEGYRKQAILLGKAIKKFLD